MKSRRAAATAITTCLLLQALALQGCALRRDGGDGSRRARISVLVIPALSSAPLIIAVEGGHLAAQGLEAEVVKIDQSAKALPSLIQGKLDVWGGSISLGILNAVARGAKIRIVADKGYIPAAGCAYSGLVARRALVDSGLEGPGSLRGLTVSMERMNFEGYYFEKLLSLAGLALRDLNIVDVPHSAEVEVLSLGKVDMIAMTEPALSRALQRGGAVWLSAGRVIPGFHFGCLVYGPSLLEKDPDLGRRFMAAYLAAVRQYNEGKTERNLEILAGSTGLEREFLRRACWPAVAGDGRIDPSGLLDFQDWGLRNGLLDRKLPVEEMIDPEFVEEAAGAASGRRQQDSSR